MGGPGGEAQANAISRRWLPNLRPGHHCGGNGPTTGAGQTPHVRLKGRRQGIVCGPHEVNLVTTARGEPLVGTPTRGR